MKFNAIRGILLGLSFTIGLLGCTSDGSKKDSSQAHEDAIQPEFDRGMRALDHEDFVNAADIFDHLLVAKPASEMDLVITYDSGVAHEGLGECPKAAERYREVVRGSAGKYQRVEAQALYRLSLMYECLGQDAKTVTSLLDARKRAKDLPLEIERAEIPARLAAAYSRLGNREKALEYFSQASVGLKAILAKGTSAKAQKEAMSRTLFFMGHLNTAQKAGAVDPIGYLKSLSMQQPYLLQAVEIGHLTWSRKAADDLTAAYDNMMNFQFKDRQQKYAFYTQAMQVIAELRKIRMPDGGVQEDNIFVQVDKTQRRIQMALADASVTNPMTAEAEKREGLKREGRIVDAPRASQQLKNKKKAKKSIK